MLDNAFASIDLKKRGLDGSWLRNDLISNNLANVNTPGYKRQDVDFQQILKDYLGQGKLPMTRTNSKHLPMQPLSAEDVGFTVTRDTSSSHRKDENSVNVDVEMAELAKNQILYNTMLSGLNSEIKRLRSSIKEGR